MRPAPSGGVRLRALLGGNVLWLSAASFLNDAASEMIYPLLPLFLTATLGAGPAFLGVVEGVAESAASLLKLAGGWAADRTGRRRALVAWGYGIAALARPLVGLATAPAQVLAVRLADRAGKGLRTAPRDALLADSVPPERRGTAFGIHRASDHAGAVAGPLLASGLLLLYPGQLRLVFLLALAPGLLTVLVLLLRVRDTPPPAVSPAPSDGPARPGLRGLGPAFPRYLAVLVLFTLGNSTDAFLLLRAQQLGVAPAAIPLLWAALHVSKSAWSVPGGMVADRFGARRSVAAGWAWYAAVYAGFALAGAAWHAWALFAAYGLFFGLTEAPEKALVARLAPPGAGGRAFGAYHFAVGVAALPASILFGLAWEGLGARAAFLLGAGVALLAAALLPLALRGSGE